jgi:hypothetical protein
MSETGVSLSANGLSTDELFDYAQHTTLLISELSRKVDLVAGWHKEAVALEEKKRLWVEYEDLCRDYAVLDSWYHAIYSAYVFSVFGCELLKVTQAGLYEDAIVRQS